jgi:hypothetical protein
MESFLSMAFVVTVSLVLFATGVVIAWLCLVAFTSSVLRGSTAGVPESRPTAHLRS